MALQFKPPTEYGLPFVLRSFLPGLILTMLLLIGIAPHIPVFSQLWNGLSTEVKAILVLFAAFIFGAIVTSLDYVIYTFYEGRFFWIRWVRKWMTTSLKHKVERLYERNARIKKEKQELRNATGLSKKEIQEKLDSLENERREIWFELRMFPVVTGEDGEKRFPQYPTRIGNLLCEEERYPLVRYGMDPVFYWYRLMHILPSDVRSELDRLKALPDFLIYSSAVLAAYALIHLVVYSLEQAWFQALTIFGISLGLSYLTYRASLTSVRNLSEYTKGVYDTYRNELKKRINPFAADLPIESESRFWKKTWRYLQYGRIEGDCVAFVLLRLKANDKETISSKLIADRLVSEAYPVRGEYHVVAKCSESSPEALNAKISRLRSVNEVEKLVELHLVPHRPASS